jgi:hypothetical protein
MKVAIACLADHTSVGEPGGKLNINGIFDRLTSPSFPVGPASAAARVVLVVNDDPLVRAYTARVLAEAGYVVFTAGTGKKHWRQPARWMISLGWSWSAWSRDEHFERP